MIVDLDGLKRINDVSGHVAGDQALGTLADALRATIRATDVACRLGGDEFGIILPGSTAEDAVKVAERAQETLAQIGHGQYSFSGGIARVTAHQSSAENVYRSADLAAYRAKAAGGCPHPPRDRDEGGGGSLASSSYSRCCMGEGNGGRGLFGRRSAAWRPRPGGSIPGPRSATTSGERWERTSSAMSPSSSKVLHMRRARPRSGGLRDRRSASAGLRRADDDQGRRAVGYPSDLRTAFRLHPGRWALSRGVG